jgi:hypothetical protein
MLEGLQITLLNGTFYKQKGLQLVHSQLDASTSRFSHGSKLRIERCPDDIEAKSLEIYPCTNSFCLGM